MRKSTSFAMRRGTLRVWCRIRMGRTCPRREFPTAEPAPLSAEDPVEIRLNHAVVAIDPGPRQHSLNFDAQLAALALARRLAIHVAQQAANRTVSEAHILSGLGVE